MNKRNPRIIIGVFLILAGAFFLVQQLFNFPMAALFVALLFAAAGAVFLYIVIQDHNKWWALIPGFTLVGLGMLIAVGKYLPVVGGRFGGAIFLGMIALSFLCIRIIKTDHWWPIIPAGVLATLAIITVIPGKYGLLIPAVLFMGIGATFGVVGLMPVGKQEKWPWIPAGICLGIGLIFLLSSGALFNTAFGWVWALAFILGGAYLVIRSLVKKS